MLGGPIVQNKAHFFFSLERQVDNPNRTRVFATRPSLNFSSAEDRTDWNTLIRFDHQINANHTWAVRWLREWAPQYFTYRHAPDQGIVPGRDRPRSDRGRHVDQRARQRQGQHRPRREDLGALVARQRLLPRPGRRKRPPAGFKFGEEDTGQPGAVPAAARQHPASSRRRSTESQGPWDSNYQVEDNFSWFLPGKKGDHDLKFGARYNYTELRRVSQINMNGTFRFNTDLPFDAANPQHLSRALHHPHRRVRRVHQEPHLRVLRAGQVADRPQTTINVGLRYDLELIPLDETDNPLFAAGNKHYPVDKNNFSPRIGFTRALDAEGKSVIRAGYGIFYNRTILGAVDDAHRVPEVHQLDRRSPSRTTPPIPGPSAGRFPTDPYLVNGPFVNRALLDAAIRPARCCATPAS